MTLIDDAEGRLDRPDRTTRRLSKRRKPRKGGGVKSAGNPRKGAVYRFHLPDGTPGKIRNFDEPRSDAWVLAVRQPCGAWFPVNLAFWPGDLGPQVFGRKAHCKAERVR